MPPIRLPGHLLQPSHPPPPFRNQALQVSFSFSNVAGAGRVSSPECGSRQQLGDPLKYPPPPRPSGPMSSEAAPRTLQRWLSGASLLPPGMRQSQSSLGRPTQGRRVLLGSSVWVPGMLLSTHNAQTAPQDPKLSNAERHSHAGPTPTPTPCIPACTWSWLPPGASRGSSFLAVILTLRRTSRQVTSGAARYQAELAPGSSH